MDGEGKKALTVESDVITQALGREAVEKATRSLEWFSGEDLAIVLR